MNVQFEFDPEIVDAFADLGNGCCRALWFWWRMWIFTAELRLMIQLFLNINPYFYPVYYIWRASDLIYNGGRRYYPKIIGLDICAFVNFAIVMKIEALLDRLAHGVDKYNIHKFPNYRRRMVPIEDIIQSKNITDSSEFEHYQFSSGTEVSDLNSFDNESLLFTPMLEKSSFINLPNLELATNEILYSPFIHEFIHF